MINLIVESSVKAKKINELLKENSLSDDFKCIFCNGRIYDLKVNDSDNKWHIINNETFNFLKNEINSHSHTIIMTDNDPQGELIAHQIELMSEGKVKDRAILNNLSYECFKKSIMNLKTINYNTVFEVMNERLFAIDIFREQLKKGYKPFSLSCLQLSDELNKPVYKISETVDFDNKKYQGSYLDTNTEIDLGLCKKGGANTYDIISTAAMTENSDIGNQLQSLYLNGSISYGRTDCRDWYKENLYELSMTTEEVGYLFDTGLFERHINSDMPHSALYVNPAAEDSWVTKIIRERCIDCLTTYGHENSIHLKSSIDVNYRFEKTEKNNGKVINTTKAREAVLYHIMKKGIMKPSTLENKINNIVQTLYEKETLNQYSIDYISKIKRNLFPNLDVLRKDTHKSIEINQSNVSLKAIEKTNNDLEIIR